MEAKFVPHAVVYHVLCLEKMFREGVSIAVSCQVLCS